MKRSFFKPLYFFLLLFSIGFSLSAAKKLKAQHSITFEKEFLTDKNYKNKKLKGWFRGDPSIDETEKALTLDGKTQLIFTDISANKFPRKKITVSGWVNMKKGSKNTHQFLLTMFADKNEKTKKSESSGWIMELKKSGEDFVLGFRVAFKKGEGFTSVEAPRKAFVMDQWNHIAATYDGKAMKLYINSRLVATEKVAGIIKYSKSCQLVIGGHQNGNLIADGKIHRFDVYKTALPKATIKKLYLATPQKFHVATYAEEMTKVTWKLSKKSLSGKKIKSSPKKYKATLQNTAIPTKKGLLFSEGQFAEIKEASAKNLPFRAFSVEAWIKPSICAKGGILSAYDAEKQQGWALYLDSDRHAYFHAAIGPKRKGLVRTSKKLSMQTWHHLMANFTGKRLDLYLNGKRQESIDFEEAMSYSKETKLLLGAMDELNAKDKSIVKRSFQGEISQLKFSAKTYKGKSVRSKHKSSKKSFASDSRGKLPKYTEPEFAAGIHVSHYKEKQLDRTKLLALKPESSQQLTNFDLPAELAAKQGTIEYFAHCQLGEVGKYNFSVEGDKTAVLYLDGEIVFKGGKSVKAIDYKAGYVSMTLLYNKVAAATTPKIFYSLNGAEKVELGPEYFMVTAEQRHYVSVELKSNFGHYGSLVLSRAYDNNLETAYVGPNGPTKAQERYVTLTMSKPVFAQGVKVVTGTGKEAHNVLRFGVLEISSDGKTFERIADFSGKSLDVPFSKKLVKMIRIRSNTPQSSWLAIQEIKIQSLELARPK